MGGERSHKGGKFGIKKEQQQLADVTQDGENEQKPAERQMVGGEGGVECRDGESVLIKTLNLTQRRRADESEINPLIASRRRQ